jgi:hypothetical protein
MSKKIKIPLIAFGTGVSLEESRRKLVGSNHCSAIYHFFFISILKLPFSLNSGKPFCCVVFYLMP